MICEARGWRDGVGVSVPEGQPARQAARWRDLPANGVDMGMPGPDPVRPIVLPTWMDALRALIGGAPPPPPPPEWGTGGAGPPGSDSNPLTQGQAVWLFRLMAEQEHIPFGYAREYCFARAHEMYRLMTELGIEARKVWNLAENYGEDGFLDDQGDVRSPIRVEHPAQGTIFWVYHVAPTVSVQTPQGPVRMVVDPSLFQGPATEAQWRGTQEGHNSRWEESGGEFYRPGTRDDDFSQTRRDLDAARNSSEAWLHGIVPPADAEAAEEGIVPDEDSAEPTQEAVTPRSA